MQPTGSVSVSPRKKLVDLQDYQRVRFEGLAIHGALTQDVIHTILSLLKNATIAGQTRVRVQTLHLARDYAYSRHQPPDATSLLIHDMLTFEPFTGTKTRIHLASRARELVEWLVGEQKVRVVAATCCMSDTKVFGEPAFASFMHLYAILVPEKQDVPPTVWNATFVRRSQSVQHWNDKCLAALRVGASFTHICVLYKGPDFNVLALSPSGGGSVFECVAPRHHLTMALLAQNGPGWVLKEDACSTLVAWVAQTGYKWTLTVDVQDVVWAFFTVLLMPLDAM